MIYDFKVKDNEDTIVNLEQYKGKVLLIVNTATGCGFTPQYKGLQEIYNEFKEQGFEILDFPSNQFANQTPGSDKEISSFCSLNYGTTFKRFSKINVNGDNEEPLFTYLKDQKKGLFGKKIKWNFTKFLIDRDGKVVARFSPATKPEKFYGKIKKYVER